MPHPGQRVTDNIELIAPIAVGAMGKVWVAYHHRLQVQVAVKFVLDSLGDETEEAMARFDAEASMASQINSPHVVSTYDSGISLAGEPYIVMELLQGQDLQQRLTTGGPLSWSEATQVIAQVARALTKAHAIGIVHRDIKPGNIFLSHDVDGIFCKILDFGIAKQTRLPAMGGFTTDGKMVGTPEYMSPELVFDGCEVDYRADLWALAVCMYRAISGMLPYRGSTLGKLCINLVSTTPALVSSIRPDLPAGADGWFVKALARDPADRFASARDMALAFGQAGSVHNDDLASPTLLGVSRDAALAAVQVPPPLPAAAPASIFRPTTVAAAVVLLALVAGGTAAAVVANQPDVAVARAGIVTPALSTLASLAAPPSSAAPAASASPSAAATAAATASASSAAHNRRDGGNHKARVDGGRPLRKDDRRAKPPIAARRAAPQPQPPPKTKPPPATDDNESKRRGKDQLGF